MQHYLRSFGPATENDVAWWTGLGKTQVRQALSILREQVVHIRVSNLKDDFLMFRSDEKPLKDIALPQKPIVNMLPTLDPYLMGYKERERYLRNEHYDNVFDRSGNATSTILLNGRAIGVWDFAEEAEPTVKLFFFREVEESTLKEIHLEAEKIGKFIADKQVKIKECDSMVPLTRRTAGGVMSPLKSC